MKTIDLDGTPLIKLFQDRIVKNEFSPWSLGEWGSTSSYDVHIAYLHS
ncbi:hypothetical protein [Sphingobacterium olei]|nr:hypothetical protein [Sphingobacterium olei]